jgi:hypothetical protein
MLLPKTILFLLFCCNGIPAEFPTGTLMASETVVTPVSGPLAQVPASVPASPISASLRKGLTKRRVALRHLVSVLPQSVLSMHDPVRKRCVDELLPALVRTIPCYQAFQTYRL